MVAAGPLVIITIRSARRRASSTSWVTMRTVAPVLLPERHQLVLQLHAGEGVEKREGLVEEQQPRLQRERPRDADSLLHARRQLAGYRSPMPREPDRAQVGVAPPWGPPPRRTCSSASRTLSRTDEPWQQGGRLEDHAAVRARAVHLAARR